MRIFSVSIFMLSVSLLSYAQNDVSYFRTLFQNASSESDFENILETEVENKSQNEVNIIASYKAVAHATMAKYAFNPYSKMKYFTEGKNQLEALIAKDKSVDNVFLRLILQLNTPEFLNYHDNIEQDLKYFIDHVNDSELNVENRSFMMETILKGRKTNEELMYLFDTLEQMKDTKK